MNWSGGILPSAAVASAGSLNAEVPPCADSRSTPNAEYPVPPKRPTTERTQSVSPLFSWITSTPPRGSAAAAQAMKSSAGLLYGKGGQRVEGVARVDHGAAVGQAAEVAVEAGQVFGEGIPLAVDSGLEGRQRHALDPGHHAPRVVAVARRQRSEGEAAVAGDDGGDPVQVRRRCRRVPQDLRVVVGVRIDEPRAHHVAAGVDDLSRLR